MSGSWHVGVKLPDGRRAYADHADPIVTVMRRINRHVADSRVPRRPEDDATVAAWLDAHAEQVEACLADRCGHTT